jgi:hypothetical protein
MMPRATLAASLALVGCSDVRQIALVIDTTAGVPCDIDRVSIRASSSGPAATVFDQPLADARLPITVTLLDDTPGGDFAVEVIGARGDVDVLATTGMLRFDRSHLTMPVVLDAACTVDQPCALSDAEPGGTPSPVARRACVTRYLIEDALETFEDACDVPGAGRVLIDGSRGPVPLDELADALPGFGFRFYGRPLEQIWIHRDGFISLGRDNPDPDSDLVPGPFDRDIVGAGAPPPQRSVMAFWDELSLRLPIGVCYSLQGTPGSQVLRVSWSRACLTFPCTADNLNVAIALSEANQTITLTYGEMHAGAPGRAQGATATVGIVDQADGCPASECARDTGLCGDGVTPCGYSQVFSRTIQVPRVKNVQLTPVLDPP